MENNTSPAPVHQLVGQDDLLSVLERLDLRREKQRKRDRRAAVVKRKRAAVKERDYKLKMAAVSSRALYSKTDHRLMALMANHGMTNTDIARYFGRSRKAIKMQIYHIRSGAIDIGIKLLPATHRAPTSASIEELLKTAATISVCLPNAKADLAPASGAQVQRLVGPLSGGEK